MKTVFKHILRNIKEKKGRSILIIVSLVIASCTLILNLTIPKQIVEANINKTKNLVGTSDLVIAKYEKFNIDDIKLNNEDINYVGVNQNSFIHQDKTFMVYGTDADEAYKLKLISENNLKDDEIIISKNAASKFNYKINDKFIIELDDKTYELKIVNIVDNKGLLYFKTYSGIVNNITYNKIFNQNDNKYNSYYVDVIDDENTDSFIDYSKENNDEILVQKLVDENAIKENNAYVEMILKIVFVMAVIMIFFVVNTLNKMIVLERTPVIATFRSIGATKTKMNLILIFENVMYGVFGGIFGSLLSLLINNFCVKLLLGGDSLHTTVPFINLILGVLFAIILEIIMSIGAIIKSNKYSIKELMFDKQSSKYELSKKEAITSIVLIVGSILLYLFTNDKNLLLDLLKISMFWLGVAYIIPFIMTILSKIICYIAKKLNNGSLIIASKNLAFNKMIISSSRLVVISISIMLVIFNVSATFDKMLDSFSYQFEGVDIFIRDMNKQYTDYEKLEDIKEIEKVDFVYMMTDDEIYNNGKKLDISPVILGMKNSRADIEEYDYKIKDLKENEALIDSKYAENNNLKIGDTINLKIGDINGEHKFKIVGTVNSFYFSVQREIVIINEKYFLDNISKVPFQMTVAARENADLQDVIKKIEYELKDPDITIMTVDEFVEDQRNNIHTIMYLFYVIIGLALVLSFVGIVNNQIISFMERTKEIAVLNSICMSKSQLKRMLIIENITSNLVACIIGFVSSIMSVKLINSVLNGIRMYINVNFNLNIALMFIGIVLVVLLITVILPIRKLKKINIVEAIKYE